jgi:hypothetical protein
MWQREEIRSQKVTLTVSEVTPGAILLRLEGTALLATDADVAKAAQGFDAVTTRAKPIWRLVLSTERYSPKLSEPSSARSTVSRGMPGDQ